MRRSSLRSHLRFLRELGMDRVEHDSHVPFLAHLRGVRELLREWGARAELQDAGLFHSVYGTEYFDPAGGDGPDRAAVREEIGAEAEEIAWLWCTIRRETLGSAEIVDRRGGSPLALDERRRADLVELWCADAVEQLPRMGDEEVAFSRGLLEVSHLASRPARAALERQRARVPAA